MTKLSPESFNHDFADEVRALYDSGDSLNNSEFKVSYESFAERVCRSVEKELIAAGEATIEDREAITEFIARLKADDLYLATGCDVGDEQAWQRFHDKYRRTIERVANQFCNNQAEAEDLASSLLSDLFFPTEGGESRTRIGRYSGMGSLQGWLKVLVHNRAIDRYRKNVNTTSIDDEDGSNEWETATKVVTDPTEAIIEDKYRRVASRALEAALNGLETRERLMLVFYYKDGLTLKEIAALPNFGVHEATISRWLEKVHKVIRKDFEQRLSKDEKLKPVEIRECCAIAMKSGLLEIEQYLEKTG